VTFEEQGGKTLLSCTNSYPSKKLSTLPATVGGIRWPEQFEQLDELLVTLAASGDGHEGVRSRGRRS